MYKILSTVHWKALSNIPQIRGKLIRDLISAASLHKHENIEYSNR